MAATKKASTGTDRQETEPTPVAGQAVVSQQISELIGLPNYSNLTIGPTKVTVVCEDSDEAIQESIKRINFIVESTLAEQREIILETIKSQA